MTLSPDIPVATAPNGIIGAEDPSGQAATSRLRATRGPELAVCSASGFVLGELSVAHRDRVAEILRATGVFRAEEIDVALEVFDEGIRESSPDYCLLGAFSPAGDLTGYACYGETPGTDRTFDLYWIAVHPTLQGAGIGTVLINEVERRLERLHVRMLVVETSSRSDYAPTREFYARRGYSEVSRVPEFYAPGDDRIIFTKRFHSPTGRGA